MRGADDRFCLKASVQLHASCVQGDSQHGSYGTDAGDSGRAVYHRNRRDGHRAYQSCLSLDQSPPSPIGGVRNITDSKEGSHAGWTGGLAAAHRSRVSRSLRARETQISIAPAARSALLSSLSR